MLSIGNVTVMLSTRMNLEGKEKVNEFKDMRQDLKIKE
jgi:hypothetical protein